MLFSLNRFNLIMKKVSSSLGKLCLKSQNVLQLSKVLMRLTYLAVLTIMTWSYVRIALIILFYVKTHF